MTARTHLSIGEVLSLLTDDFPDLTITKIRFLESQGLIDPERTASGYRKFYEADIERLRWILRQQRENFLPLKVIKDRLDRSDGKSADGASTTEELTEPAQAELDLARDPGAADPPPVWMADHAARDGAATNRAEASPDGASGAAAVAERPAPPPSAHPDPVASTVPAPAPDTGKPKKAKKAKAKAKAKGTSEAVAPPTAATTAGPDQPADPPQETASMAASTNPAPPAADASADLTDVSLSRAELLTASGLTDRQLTDLESYGIVAPTDGLDDPVYGADALVCARQSATFLGFGMEPRHLRAFKVAADREAGLYEQLILPLLRQRNPAARSEAGRLVGQLTSSGAALHAALLKQSLRSQLRPRR